MSEEIIEKKLAELFEARLRDFFAKSIPEKLEETAKHFEKIEIGQRINGQFYPISETHFHILKDISVKLLEYIENGFDKDAHPSVKKHILNLHERELRKYIANKWQEAFFLLTPLFLTTFYLFDETGSELLSKDLRDEMLPMLGLETPKKRKEICLDYLKQLLIDERVRHGGSKGFWDEIKRVQFLAHYNRFFFVIKNALGDYKKLTKLKQTPNKIWEQIKEKYGIPEDYIQDFSIPQSPADRALEWAKRELKTNDSNEHLRNRVLRQARIEFKKSVRNKNSEVIVSITFNESKEVISSYTIDPADKRLTQRLRFPPRRPDIEYLKNKH